MHKQKILKTLFTRQVIDNHQLQIIQQIISNDSNKQSIENFNFSQIDELEPAKSFHNTLNQDNQLQKIILIQSSNHYSSPKQNANKSNLSKQKYKESDSQLSQKIPRIILSNTSLNGRESLAIGPKDIMSPKNQSCRKIIRRQFLPENRIKQTSNVYRGMLGNGMKVLNHYHMLMTLGKGAYGKVKLASSQGNLFAVKIIHKFKLAKITNFVPTKNGIFKVTNQFESVLNEIQVMKMIRHPNIVKLQEVIDDLQQGKLYLIQEYVEGGQLCTWDVQNERFENKQQLFNQDKQLFIKMALRDCARGVNYLHKLNIVHRDIKPQNILLSQSSAFKLCDFGLSLIINSFADEDLTQKGTLPFIPPENFLELKPINLQTNFIYYQHKISKIFQQCCKKKPLNSSLEDKIKLDIQKDEKLFILKQGDVWCLGLTLYCLAFGFHPFYHKKMQLIPYLIKYKKLQFPKHDYDAKFLLLLQNMLDKNPYTRITMKEVLKNEWINEGFRSVTRELGIETILHSEFEIQRIQISLNAIIFVVLFMVKLRRKRQLGIIRESWDNPVLFEQIRSRKNTFLIKKQELQIRMSQATIIQIKHQQNSFSFERD